MNIEFYKYQGTGNDFVMIDNRREDFPKENTKLIAWLCHRRFGIGADGCIFLEHSDDYDFKMVYYNSDGNQSSMCGNGGRCIVAFAKELGIITDSAKFIAIDGEHKANIDENGTVELQMKDIHNVEVAKDFVFLDTGSPHHVEYCEDVEGMNVKERGRAIRYGALYGNKGGCNVNFVEQLSDNLFRVRTYERGVEEETFSCGTGATAVAIAMNRIGKTSEEKIHLQTKGGNLTVLFERKENKYQNVWLCGKASLVFRGNVFCQL